MAAATKPAQADADASLFAESELLGDPVIKRWIRSYEIPDGDIEFLPDASVADFDLAESQQNQARSDKPVDEAWVAQYATDMAGGAHFPPLVAWRRRGKLVIIDGNHRLVAAGRVGQSVAVYVVTATTAVISLMTLEANARHGRAISAAERMIAAQRLVNMRVPINEAATRFGVDPKQLQRSVDALRVDKRAEDAQVNMAQWEQIRAEFAKTRLASIELNDVMRKAVELTAKAKLSSDEVNLLVSQLKTIRDAEQKIAFLDAKMAENRERIQGVLTGDSGGKGRGAGRGRSGVNAPRSVLNLTFGQIKRLPNDDSEVVEGILPAEREGFARQLRDNAARLQRLADALAPR